MPPARGTAYGTDSARQAGKSKYEPSLTENQVPFLKKRHDNKGKSRRDKIRKSRADNVDGEVRVAYGACAPAPSDGRSRVRGLVRARKKGRFFVRP